MFSLHFLAFTYLASVFLLVLNPTPDMMNTRTIIVSLGITLAFMAYLFAGMRKIYGQGGVKTFFKMVIAYAVIQVMVVVTLNTVLVLSIVRAAKAK